ncbi:Uncharacterised protein [Bordetella pertussis]|nr:Uncharacterised protein [Bordetella pertussis]
MRAGSRGLHAAPKYERSPVLRVAFGARLVRVLLRAHGGAHAGDVDQVLDGHGDAMQRARRGAAGEGGVGVDGLPHDGFRVDADETVQRRGGYPVQQVAQGGGRGGLARAVGRREGSNGQHFDERRVRRKARRGQRPPARPADAAVYCSGSILPLLKRARRIEPSFWFFLSKRTGPSRVSKPCSWASPAWICSGLVPPPLRAASTTV